MNTNDFLDKVERAWNDWQERISCFPPEKMLEVRIYDEWSLKDVITHLTWYEQEMVRMLEMRELAGSELWEIPLDERNELIRRQMAEKTLQEILDEANRVHERLMELLPALADSDLQEPGCIGGMPPDWKPWEVLASNTFEHYEEHLINLDDLKDQS